MLIKEREERKIRDQELKMGIKPQIPLPPKKDKSGSKSPSRRSKRKKDSNRSKRNLDNSISKIHSEVPSAPATRVNSRLGSIDKE